MSTSELERRLGEVLRQHAEEAMNSTDTQARFETLDRDLERNRPRIRIGWVAAAAAAAAVIAGARRGRRFALTTDRALPRGPGRHGSRNGSRVGFMDAVAAYDADRAASYLADEAGFMYDDWPGAMRPELTERSARLWAKNVDGYVRAVERGNASETAPHRFV